MLYAVMNNKLTKSMKITDGTITIQPLKRHNMIIDLNREVIPEVVDAVQILP